MTATDANEVLRLSILENEAKGGCEYAMNESDIEAMKRAAEDYQKASNAFAAYVLPHIQPYADGA